MIVYLSDKLDDINLSPEAFRLYVHLRCQSAKAIGNGCSAESLILPTQLGHVLEWLGLPADSPAILELERRRIVSFSYDWEERETRVVFHHEDMWQ